MARLSAEHYRDQAGRSSSMSKRITGIFKGRNSSQNDGIDSQPLKPGFSKVGLFPHERHLRKQSGGGQNKVPVPFALDISLEPAATMSSPSETMAMLDQLEGECTVQAPVSPTRDNRISAVNSSLVSIAETGESERSSPGAVPGDHEEIVRVQPVLARNSSVRTVDPPTRPTPMKGRVANITDGDLDDTLIPKDTMSNITDVASKTKSHTVKDTELGAMSTTAPATVGGTTSRKMVRYIRARPQYVKIGPFPVTEPVIVRTMQQGMTYIYIATILVAALAGPKCLLLVAWRIGIFLGLYKHIIEGLGWDENQVVDAILEPIAYVIATVGPAAVRIARDAGFLFGPLVGNMKDEFTRGWNEAEEVANAVSSSEPYSEATDICYMPY